ncbi:class I SAM-dependent methyltransferase [Roseivivax sediminis]|uniref:Methyltransferase domain-containing protein n=1 Tax=Roseivivax sediminis TaxID=936889 RepID=A0A1I1YRY0_9RHOB|nr:class I SAM-dependent methyltransferase [Roseivivax sediminis]SFE22062.1 Methyltransferase domain-containing protein [Roseivivax sediminis]
MNSAAFWDRIAPRYAKQPIADTSAYEATLARVRTYLGSEDRVLELGCGTGTTALRLAGDVLRYTATDISSAMIEIAEEKRWADGAGNVTFRQGGVTPAEYDAETFDAVLAFNLLHLVPDVGAALATVAQLLPRGGLFISKTPAIGEKWYYRPMIWVMKPLGKAPDVTFLTVPQIDRAIAAAGFEIIETGLYPPSTPSRFVVARKR